MNVPWETREPTGFRKVAMRITVIYVLIGGAWVLFSDRILYLAVTDITLLTRLQTAKGWLYVASTALFLYWGLHRYLAAAERDSMARGESEARFQAIFQTAPVSIWEVDFSAVKARLDTLRAQQVADFGQYFTDQPEFVLGVLQEVKVLDVNETTLKIFAAGSKAELLSALPRLFEPESLRVFRAGLTAIAEGRGSFQAEATILTLGGARRELLVSLVIPPDGPRFGNLPVSFVDISERKQTEEMLRLLESAVQQTREAITITTADLDPPGPLIVYVNPAFTAITGYEAGEVLGKTPRILHGPKTDRAVLDLVRQTLWQRRPFQCQTINYRKDGTEFVMEWYVVPLVNKQFQVTHFVAVQRDITEQKRADEALRESEALLRAIFEQAFQLMGLMKPDGTLIKINRTAAEFIKTKAGEVLGKPFWETPWWTHSPEQQERLRQAVNAAARGEFVRFEATHLTSEGKVVYVDFSIKPVKDEKGDVVLLVPEGRDITERKQAEEEIRKLNLELERRISQLEAAKGRDQSR